MAGLKLRVLDVSDGIAGPYCARLLADYGADVIKIEPPEGDSSRREGFVKDDVSVLYTYINQNKRGITADLETASGQAILKRLVETADIMVESFAPGTLDRLGLGYQELKAINPRLVLVSLTHFGQTGPYRDYKATHFTTHALSSWLTGVGDPDKPPVQMGYPVFYYKTGVNGAIGALAAIRGRRLTGKGQHVDVSVFETCGDLAGESLAVSFKIPEMKRRRRVPDFIKAKDGWIGLTVGNFEEWKNVWLLANMLDVLDEPDLIQDEVKREQRRPELEARLNDWGKDKTREEIFFAAQELRVGGGIAYSPGETLACQQFVERDFFVKTTHPKLGEYKQPRAPFVSPFSLTESRPAPDLGEHNEEVFAEIGLDREGRETSSPTAQSQQAPNPSGTDGGGDLLAGMRVLDLTHWWSGPFVTWLLGALGADVIKIEAQQRPDPYRFLFAGKADVPNWIERGYLWNNTNVNKRGITLDLASEKGKDLFLEMVKESDLVVENFSPRVMRNLGLEYEKLREINPKIVMISMSCYGPTSRATGPTLK